MAKLVGSLVSGAPYVASGKAVQNDYGQTLYMSMREVNDSGVNLVASGVTLLSARRRSDSTNLISGQSCTVVSGLGGQITYILQSGNLANKGRYYLQTSYRASGLEKTCDGFILHVLSDITPR